jgi:hypothetical protein
MQNCIRVVVCATTVFVLGMLLVGFGSGLRAEETAVQPTGADPCVAPGNKIVAENCRPGNRREEWDVNGGGDPEIQGFATDISVNIGETVEFKIKTHSPRYRIDIYRMGWYGGSGARLIESIRPSAMLPQAQPPCRVHRNFRFVDCGNWRVSASWQVPADGVSGVYVARLVREDDDPEPWQEFGFGLFPTHRPPEGPHAYGANGLGTLVDTLEEKRASHIIFVVRDDAGRSDVLVQTADPTWVAFNRYGGSNLYGAWSAVDGLGAAGNDRARAFMASYNRPNTNRDGDINDQFFSGEYPMVRWLERNGYDVSYFSGVDTDRRGEDIQDHKIFVSGGHDAYWSDAQRMHVEAARDAGVHLAFMGGGVSMWKTRYRPSLEGLQGSDTPYRTLVSFRETVSHGRMDTQNGFGNKEDLWTGTWRDPREFNPEGAHPENALTGTINTVGSFRNDRLHVPASYGQRRFWRNTEVAGLEDGEMSVFGRGVLGHEWDQDIDNGVRPSGLIRLSETTVDNVAYLQDWGSVYDSGSATHHLTLYRASSGALVFSAGSAQYSWGLDDLHTYWTRPDGGRVRHDLMGAVPAMQQATVNLLADMEVQPASLQPELMPAEASQDRTGPLAQIMVPSNGDAVGTVVTIEGTAVDQDGGVVSAVEVSTDGGITWHPANGTETWRYEWQVPPGLAKSTILSRATDDSANLGPLSPVVRVRGAVTQSW